AARGAAALEAPGRELVAVAHQADGDAVAGTVALGDAEAAAVKPGAPAVRHQTHLLDEEGIAYLEHLGRHHAAVAVDAVDRVVAVRERPSAPAGGEEVVADIVVAGAAVDAAEQEVAVGGGVGGETAVRSRLGQGADHGVGDARVG